MSSSQPKLLVVGCPRGGTSLVAQYLLDVGLRTVTDDRESADYPAGFNEHLPILLFNKACERLRGPRDRLTSDPLVQSSFLGIGCMRRFCEDAYSVFDDPTVDFIKSPDLALALDFMRERFPGVRFLAVWRRPELNIESFYRRELGRHPGALGLLRSVGVWNMYARRILDFQSRHPDLITVADVDALVAGRARLLDALDRHGVHVPDRRELADTLRKKWRTEAGWLGRTATALDPLFRLLAGRDKRRYFETARNAAALKTASI